MSAKKLFNVAQNLSTKLYRKTNIGKEKTKTLLDSFVKKEENLTNKVVPFLKTKSEAVSSHILKEFFDDPKNWPESEVKVGRSWKLDELRIKSNTDLHKLWYILLKERNMLLTMEHECNEQMELFPSPERIDKVKRSMKNLETVVRERNTAYYLLETGYTGERPKKLVYSNLGIKYVYKSCEHVLPPFMNMKWIKARNIGYSGRAVRKFLLQYREKLYNEKRKAKVRDRNEVMMLLRRNPDLNLKELGDKYPDVEIDKLIKSDKTRGHYVPKIEFLNKN